MMLWLTIGGWRWRYIGLAEFLTHPCIERQTTNAGIRLVPPKIKSLIGDLQPYVFRNHRLDCCN